MKARLRWRKWAEKNKEHRREYSRRYQIEHPEVHKKASRKYCEKHRKSRTEAELKSTATWIGRRCEIDAMNILRGSDDLNAEKMNYPGFDLLWEGKKIDVKGKRLWRRRKNKVYIRKTWEGHVSKGQWTFHANESGKAEYILCLGYSEDGKTLLRAFLIPKASYGRYGVTVMEGGGKFSCFELPIPS